MRGIRLTSSPVQIFFSPILPQKDVANPSHHANAVFGLSRGLVRLYKSLPDGRRQVLAFAVPGDLLGMPLRERHTCSADAIGEVAALRWVNPQVAAIKCLSCKKRRIRTAVSPRRVIERANLCCDAQPACVRRHRTARRREAGDARADMKICDSVCRSARNGQAVDHQSPWNAGFCLATKA